MLRPEGAHSAPPFRKQSIASAGSAPPFRKQSITSAGSVPPFRKQSIAGSEHHALQLRDAARFEDAHGHIATGFQDDEPEIIFHRRLEFVSWGYLRTWWWCFLRSNPVAYVFVPRPAPNRFRRAAELALNLSFALLFATLLSRLCDCGLDDDAADDGSSMSTDFKEAWEVTETVPFGLCSYLFALPLALLMIKPISVLHRGDQMPLVQQFAWWRGLRWSFTINSMLMLMVAMLLWAAALVFSSQQSQMRCAIGWAMFCVAAAMYVLVSPAVKALPQTIMLRCFARWGCFSSFISCCPWMLDFSASQIPFMRWTDSDALTAHMDGVAVERKISQSILSNLPN